MPVVLKHVAGQQQHLAAGKWCKFLSPLPPCWIINSWDGLIILCCNKPPSGSNIQPCLKTVALWEASPRNKVRWSKESTFVSASSKAQEPKWGFLFIAIERTISSNSRKSTSENFPIWPNVLKFVLKSIFKINSLHFLLWSPQLAFQNYVELKC